MVQWHKTVVFMFREKSLKKIVFRYKISNIILNYVVFTND